MKAWSHGDLHRCCFGCFARVGVRVAGHFMSRPAAHVGSTIVGHVCSCTHYGEPPLEVVVAVTLSTTGHVTAERRSVGVLTDTANFARGTIHHKEHRRHDRAVSDIELPIP